MNGACLHTDLGTQDREDEREENAFSAILWNSAIMSNTADAFAGISIHLFLHVAAQMELLLLPLLGSWDRSWSAVDLNVEWSLGSLSPLTEMCLRNLEKLLSQNGMSLRASRQGI